jgi:hypothetical protein
MDIGHEMKASHHVTSHPNEWLYDASERAVAPTTTIYETLGSPVLRKKHVVETGVRTRKTRLIITVTARNRKKIQCDESVCMYVV